MSLRREVERTIDLENANCELEAALEDLQFCSDSIGQ